MQGPVSEILSWFRLSGLLLFQESFIVMNVASEVRMNHRGDYKSFLHSCFAVGFLLTAINLILSINVTENCSLR
jgi:hypothetical protein